jgi:cytochrome c oxidase subunit IV
MSTEFSKRTYFGVFGALILLTFVTTGVAYLDLGVLNTPMALAIAVAKAFLVMMFFMHLRQGDFLTKVFAGAGVLWLAHLLIFMLSDYLTR